MIHSFFPLSQSLTPTVTLSSFPSSLSPSKYKRIASPQCGTVPYIAVRKNGISLSESYLPDARVCLSVPHSVMNVNNAYTVSSIFKKRVRKRVTLSVTPPRSSGSTFNNRTKLAVLPDYTVKITQAPAV